MTPSIYMKAKTSPQPTKKSLLAQHTPDARQNNLFADVARLQSDVEFVFKDEQEIFSRPNILYSLAATVVATCGAAYYHGTTTVSKLALKAIYATLAQIIGVNVGLAIDNVHADNITFAGGYYLLTTMSGNLSQLNNKNGMEAIAGAVAGYAANYYYTQSSA